MIGGIQYQILDRRLAETTVADVPYAVITITGSEQEFARIPDSENRLGLLRLKFDDIQTYIESMTTFDAAHARQALNFFDEMRAKGAKRFIINCEMGRCRSSGLGAGLAESLGLRSAWFDRRFEPNAHVRRVMVEAALLRRAEREGATSAE